MRFFHFLFFVICRLKVSGELLPGVIHVASRSVAKQTGCLYCDYSDVFSTRGVRCFLSFYDA